MSVATLLNEHSIELPGYSEVSIESGRAPITLSIWEAEQDAAPAVVFVPGTMTHPLFYSPFLDAVSRHGYHVVGVHPLSHGRSPRVIRRFTLDYSRLVYERLVAPGKRLVELPADHHLILNERIENVTPTVLAALDDHLR